MSPSLHTTEVTALQRMFIRRRKSCPDFSKCVPSFSEMLLSRACWWPNLHLTEYNNSRTDSHPLFLQGWLLRIRDSRIHRGCNAMEAQMDIRCTCTVCSSRISGRALLLDFPALCRLIKNSQLYFHPNKPSWVWMNCVTNVHDLENHAHLTQHAWEEEKSDQDEWLTHLLSCSAFCGV